MRILKKQKKILMFHIVIVIKVSSRPNIVLNLTILSSYLFLITVVASEHTRKEIILSPF